ncbi:MAG: hypothetical protein PHU08_04355 [Dehalococcoidales bacterium]|nr:hypothetical protein [Dehalococcoidales bacterium]
MDEKITGNPLKNNVLYYPYINLPQTEWLTRMLLYYEKVGTITPPIYKTYPSKFSPYTRDLIKEGLVTQVFPYEYVHGVKRFSESFTEYIDSLGPEVGQRRRLFHLPPKPFQSNSMKIHISKMETICEYLVHNGLSENIDGQWYQVEISTALDFMSYLAAIIGQVDEAGFTPITDKIMPLNRLAKSVSIDARTENRACKLRLQLLKNVLPSPKQPLSPADILGFKMKHGDKLTEFRFYIEKSILDILKQQNSDLRLREIDLFNQKAKEDIEEIKVSMHKFGWITVGFANLYALLSEIPVIGVPLKITQSVYNVVMGSYSTTTKPIKNTPLLYAAIAQKELLRV